MRSWLSLVWIPFTELKIMEQFGEENGTKHVKGCFYAGRCPCSHVQKDPRLVQGEPSKLLGENSMTGELS